MICQTQTSPYRSIARLVTGCALALSAICYAGASMAQTPTLLTQERDWAAYMAEVDGGKTCYALSQPKDQEPKNVRRDPAFFFVTTRPKDNIRNQVSVIIGYPFAEGSKVTIDVGSDNFTLFTKDDKAWIENLAEQDRLVNAIKAGTSMVIKGTSKRGTNTTDTYSLLGVTAAFDRAASACE